MQSLHWSAFVKNLVHDSKTASLPRQLIAFAVFEKMFFAKELREWEIQSISEIIFTFQVWAQKIKCFQINFVHQAVHSDKRTVVFKIRSFSRLLFSVVRCWRRFASNLHWVIVFSCSLPPSASAKKNRESWLELLCRDCLVRDVATDFNEKLKHDVVYCLINRRKCEYLQVKS